MKQLKVIPADLFAPDRPRRAVKTVTFGIVFPDLSDHYQGPTLDQPDFDASPRLLPTSWLDAGDQAA